MQIIKQENGHLRIIKCNCCGSDIEYGVNETRLHSSDEDGFGGGLWMRSIDCPNCNSRIVWEV